MANNSNEKCLDDKHQNNEKEITKIVLHLLDNYFDSIHIKRRIFGVSTNKNDGLESYINFKLDDLNQLDEQGRIVVKDNETLKSLIVFSSFFLGNDINLNFLNTTQVKDMSHLFAENLVNDMFKGFIAFEKEEQSDFIKQPEKLLALFENDKFLKSTTFYNKMIDKLKGLKNFSFDDGEIPLNRAIYFNGVIKDLDTSNVVNMTCMFKGSRFIKHDLVLNMENVVYANGMFKSALFNKSFTGLNTNKLRFCREMFCNSMLKSIAIDFSNVENMENCFGYVKGFESSTIEKCNFDFKNKNIASVGLYGLTKGLPNYFDVFIKIAKNESFAQKMKEQDLMNHIFMKDEIVDLLFSKRDDNIKPMTDFIQNFLFDEKFSQSYLLSNLMNFFSEFNEGELKQFIESGRREKFLLNFVLEKLTKAPNTDFVQHCKENLKELLILQGFEMDVNRVEKSDSIKIKI